MTSSPLFSHPRSMVFCCVLLLWLCAGKFVAFGAIYTVTNTSGDETVSGSLPWALAQAASHLGVDTVAFDLSGGGTHVITLESPLRLEGDLFYPDDRVIVDGTTQPGYSDTAPPSIVIDANGLPTAVEMAGQSCEIRGLAFYRFSRVGMEIGVTGGSDAAGHVVEDCWVGMVPIQGFQTNIGQGFAGADGILLKALYCEIINCTVTGVHNGIVLGSNPVEEPESAGDYWSAAGNYIVNNQIGTDSRGGFAIGNASDGIFLGNGATYNFIMYNVIGGNHSTGIKFLGPSGQNNHVYGNLVGVSTSGEGIGNGIAGILVSNRSNANYIGVMGANYVYFNGYAGVAIGLPAAIPGTAGDAHYNHVANNWIYSNNSGASGTGILIAGGSYFNTVYNNLVFGHATHGATLLGAYANYLTENAFGYYDQNNGFGVCSQDSAWNQIYDNAFGWNLLGIYGAWGSYDNVY